MDDGRTDGRTPDHSYTISTPMSLWLRRAKNAIKHLYQGVKRRMVLVDNLFRIFQIIIFGIVDDICDLLHDVEAIYDLCSLLPASVKSFLKYERCP